MVHLLLSLLWPVMGVIGIQRIVYVNDPSLNWRDAQAYCRQHYTDLVTIETQEDNEQINENSWLGLYRNNSSAPWKWSRGDEPLTYDVAWHGNDPDDGKDCVYKRQSDQGKWKSEECDKTYAFFCVEEWVHLVKERKTWEEALAYCRAYEVMDPTVYNNHSYDLVSLMTPEDHDIAREISQTAETEQVWTGLRFLGDQWMWVVGGQVQYGDINSCPAVNHCGALDKNSTQLYSIRNCNERNNFLCYKRPAAV